MHVLARHTPVLLALCYLWACVIVYLTDGFALPRHVVHKQYAKIQRSRSRAVLEYLARLPVIALVFAGFFAISWRPIYAAQGTMSFFIIFTAISRAKFIFIREPLVFSDIALVIDVFKYKTIFYATKLNVVFWIAACTYVFGASGLYFYFEPTVLPERNRALWILAGFVVAYGPWLLLFVKPVNARLVRFSERLLKSLDLRANTVRFGTFASIVYHFIIWLGKRRALILAELRATLQHAFHELGEATGFGHPQGAPLVVVWQSESFIDLRHFGVGDLHLPNLDRARAGARQSGRMTSVFEGGYTLRTEFAVLSGLQPEDAYVDASHPYLRAAHYADVVWPMRLKRAGWLTHFIHPYDKSFFLRDRALPALGFDAMSMLDAFAHDPRTDGPYVSDQALTAKVIDIVDDLDAEQPAFLFVASMANHGPWEAGRCGPLTNPVEIYTELLRRADHSLGLLMDRLDTLDRPVWLIFYGDHAPLLKAFADPFPDPRTDYVITPLASARDADTAAEPPAPREEAPWNLLASAFAYADAQRRSRQ
nr:LTA synthase family protein [Shinella daejeonensis]